MSKQINDNEHGPGVGEGYWWCSCSSPTLRDSGQDVARDPEITAAPLGPWSLGAFCLMTGSLKKSSVSYIYEHDDNKQAKFLFFFFCCLLLPLSSCYRQGLEDKCWLHEGTRPSWPARLSHSYSGLPLTSSCLHMETDNVGRNAWVRLQDSLWERPARLGETWAPN